MLHGVKYIDEDLEEYYKECSEDKEEELSSCSSSGEDLATEGKHEQINTEGDAAEGRTSSSPPNHRKRGVALPEKRAKDESKSYNLKVDHNITRAFSTFSVINQEKNINATDGNHQNKNVASSLLFDILCSLNGYTNDSFHTMMIGSKESEKETRWVWKEDVIKRLNRENNISFGCLKKINAVLYWVNIVQDLRAELNCFETVRRVFTEIQAMDADVASYFYFEAAGGINVGRSVAASKAILVASYNSLDRFYTLVHNVNHQCSQWVQYLIEQTASLLARNSMGEETVLETVDQLLHQNSLLVTLGRLHVILKEGKGFTQLKLRVAEACQGYNVANCGDESALRNNSINAKDVCARQERFVEKMCSIFCLHAADLLDFLIIRCSIFQNTSTMELYRLYLILLLHGAWPYVTLATAVVFGFVGDIDPIQWRGQLPRLFRSSFSHIKMDKKTQKKQYPTDILSLVLTCVNYEHHTKPIKRTLELCEGSSSDSSKGVNLSSLRSSRVFILKNLSLFATRKGNRLYQKGKKVVGLTEKGTSSNSASNDVNGILQAMLRSQEEDEDMQKLSSFLPRRRAKRFSDLNGLNASTDGSSNVQKIYQPSSEVMLHFPTALPLTFKVMDDGAKPTVWSLILETSTAGLADLKLVSGQKRDKQNRTSSSTDELWVNTNVPVARWVTAALLLPIGVVIQRLQKHRLLYLLNVKSFQLSLNSSKLSTTFKITFIQALKLLVDVCLCRDKLRLVETFISSLFNYSGWWHRQVPKTVGATSSPLITNLFAEALRGKSFGELVSLKVLPKQKIIPREEGGDHREEGDRTKKFSLSTEIIETFASFDIQFCFPQEFMLILNPKELCVAIPKNTDVLQVNYSTLFWNRRRGTLDHSISGDHRVEDGDDDSSSHDGRNVWSYIFGYICCLHYAQVALTHQRKTLHNRDTQNQMILQHLGYQNSGSGSGATRLQRNFSRFQGTAYYNLSFAVDALLNFTQLETSKFLYDLEHLLKNIPKFHSAIELCVQIDTLLARLKCLCFPRQGSLCAGEENKGVGSSEALARPSSPSSHSSATAMIADSISAILRLALNLDDLPPHLITARTENAVEALVTKIKTLRQPIFLKKNLEPLLVVLTFNQYYGAQDLISFRFR